MKATRLLLFSLSALILCSQSQAFTQTYDLQFVVVQNNGINLDVKMQVKATGGSFGMGDANLVFSYPTSVLGSPVLLSAHNFNSGFYSPMTITKPSGRVSANIVFDGSSGLGTTVSSGFVDVATIRFNVLNPSGSFTLAWRSSGTGKTVVFNDLFALVTPGTFTDLSSVVAPLITSQPTNQSVLIPLTATFSVSAIGGGSLSYQWQKNSVDIGGATASVYTTPATSGPDSGAVFRCIVSNGGGSATSNGAILTAINNISGIFSDDFSGAALDPRWTFVNPLGDATLSLTGSGTSNARLSIAIPAGTTHDLWTGGAKAPRLLQPANNTDFEVAMKCESPMTSGSQILGIMALQDTANYLRFDFVRSSAGTFKVFAASVTNGTATQRGSTTITNTNPIYLKVKRVKSVWTSYYSSNGTTWTQAANFSHTLTVQKIGPFAGNAPPSGGGSIPAFTGLVDYFFNTQGPISPEDPPSATSPSITSHPSNQTVAAGITVTFTVSATGTAPLSYQWQKNAVDIGGATSSSYTTPATILADSGATFRCRVTNSAGNVTSNSAILNVGIAPGVSSHPANQTVLAGATANFSITATGTLPLSYQWQKNGVDIGGATLSSYTTPATSFGDSGATFRCRVTNSYGNVTSNVGILSVVTIPNVTSDPANQTVTLGSPATFSVTATGTQPLSYQWQKNAVDIGGATSSSYTTPATILADSGATFRCRVSNAYGNDTSNSAILNVVNGPAISTHPSSDTVAVGATATFTVVATGTPTLSYQWQKNGSNIGGATNPSYTTPATTLADSGATFRCVVSNAGGNTTSNSAMLTVLTPPNVTTNPINQTVAVGGTATFSVVASGSPSLAYQWQKNNVDIGGATAASYVTPAAIAADSGTTYRCIVANAVGVDTSNTAILSVSSNTDASGILSDNFNSPSLNTSLWTFINPLGDAPLTMTGNGASIAIPAGTAHDAWTGGNVAPRILQSANNTNFEVEAKFTTPMSVLSGQYQSEGIIIEQDSVNYLRFDFVRSSSATKIYSARIKNNVATQKSNITITAGNPLYLRVKRTGHLWTSYRSYNGTTWTTAANYNDTLVVSKVGLFFVNAGTSPPAFTGVADYFFNTAFPIVPTKAFGQQVPEEMPTEFGLSANYPNPFNPSTTIRFALPVDASVTLKVYNALGQEIQTLVDEVRPTGFSYIEWDGRSVTGDAVSSGMYFYRIKAVSIADPNRSFSSIGKMILMK